MSNLMTIVKDICQFSPRQFEGETHTAEYLRKILTKESIHYEIQKYRLRIPVILSAELTVGDAHFEPPIIEGCSFVGGEILDKSSIVDSTESSEEGNKIGKSILSCNVECPGASQANFYQIPAIAIPPFLKEKIEKEQ